MKITYLPRRLLVGIAYANEAFQSLTRRRVCCMLLSMCKVDDLDWITGDWRAGTPHPGYGYPCEMLVLFLFCESQATFGLRAFIHGRRGVAANRVTVTTFDLMMNYTNRDHNRRSAMVINQDQIKWFLSIRTIGISSTPTTCTFNTKNGYESSKFWILINNLNYAQHKNLNSVQRAWPDERYETCKFVAARCSDHLNHTPCNCVAFDCAIMQHWHTVRPRW